MKLSKRRTHPDIAVKGRGDRFGKSRAERPYLHTQIRPQLSSSHCRLWKQGIIALSASPHHTIPPESESEYDGHICDKWPTLPDGQEYDGKQLLALVRDGNSPFNCVDVNLVIQEVEAAVGATIVDTPIVTKG